MQTRKPLSIFTKKKVENTDMKQYNNSLFRLKTNNTEKQLKCKAYK